MSTTYPVVLVPVPVTDAMLTSSTIAEPAAGETLWVSGTTYALGVKVIRTETHRVYKRAVAGAGTTPPELDPDNWTDFGPTLKWAMFDGQCSTQTLGATALTVVLRPGFFNALAIYKALGADVDVTVRDAPGGTVIFSYSGSLQRPPLDWYDWAFGRIVQAEKLVLSGITPYPDAELTLTVGAATGAAVGIGMLAVGDQRPLLGDQAEWGGAQYGASAEPVDFSYPKTDEFGNTTIKKRRNTTDMRLSVVMPLECAAIALDTVKELLGVPAAYIATDAAYYEGLNVFGICSGRLAHPEPCAAVLELYVKGLV